MQTIIATFYVNRVKEKINIDEVKFVNSVYFYHVIKGLRPKLLSVSTNVN